MGATMMLFRLTAVISLMIFVSSTALANGKQFFFPSPDGASKNPNALIYAGNIKDTQGRYLSDVQIFIVATDSGITLPVKSDRPGHYRTPDIHGWIESLGGQVKPDTLRVDIRKPGYTLARPAVIPKRVSGVHAVDLLLKPTP
jgi:hypothetical protein